MPFGLAFTTDAGLGLALETKAFAFPKAFNSSWIFLTCALSFSITPGLTFGVVSFLTTPTGFFTASCATGFFYLLILPFLASYIGFKH